MGAAGGKPGGMRRRKGKRPLEKPPDRPPAKSEEDVGGGVAEEGPEGAASEGAPGESEGRAGGGGASLPAATSTEVGVANIPFSAEEDRIAAEHQSPEEKQIKDFSRTTFILFVVGVAVVTVGGLLIIVSIILFVRAGQIAPETIDAPRLGITQGTLVFSSNQSFFAGFNSDLGVFLQGLKPTNNYLPGALLWQTGKVVPLRSLLNFDEKGVLKIIAPTGGAVIWSNESDLPLVKPPPPYQLFVTDQGALAIRSQLNKEIMWQRPQPEAFQDMPYAIPGGAQIFAEQHILSEAGNYYSVFRATPGRLYLYKVEGNILIWQSPDPSSVVPAASYRCEISLFGNLQVTDERFRVGWSSQTAALTRSTLYFYEVLDRGAIVIWKRTWGENRELLWDSSVADLPETPRYSLSTAETLAQGGRLYSPSLEYYVILTQTGQFEFHSGEFVLNSTRVTGNVVTMTTSNGSMVQVDSKTQQVVWSSNTPAEDNYFPLFFTVSDNGELVWALSSGKPITISSSLDHIGKVPIAVQGGEEGATTGKRSRRRGTKESFEIQQSS